MIRYLSFLAFVLFSLTAQAGLLDYFKDEDGSTNWQYIANWSSGILILLLSVALIKLFFTHRQVRRSNRALKAIRNDLEKRVKERTATLNESNQLLKQTNQLLEQEVSGVQKDFGATVLQNQRNLKPEADSEGHFGPSFQSQTPFRGAFL